MKKQFFLLPALLMLIAAFFSCSKKSKDVEEDGNSLKITDYMIVGETFWGNNINNTPPYIMEFNTNGKVAIYTLGNKAETGYEVSGNRITLADMGYIDIENGQVSNMILAGANLKKGRLMKNTELEHKAYPRGQLMRWQTDGSATVSTSPKDLEIGISAASSEIVKKWTYNTGYQNMWLTATNKIPYIKLSGSAGASASYSDIFYVNPGDGKLVYWFLLGGNPCFYKY